MTAPNIGDLLVALGHVTEADLARALRYQQDHPTMRLGACLVKIGCAARHAVAEALTQQTIMRTGVTPDLEVTTRLADLAADKLDKLK